MTASSVCSARRNESIPEKAELTAVQREFHTAEFAKLNTEIAELIKSAAHLFGFSVATSGVIFAWLLASETPATVPDIGYWIPTVLTLGCAFMAYAQARRIDQMGSYLRKVEDELGHPKLGWERHFAEQSSIVGLATKFGWLILLLGNIVAAVRLT